MNVEEERSIDVPRAHFAKVRLIPANVIRLFDLVQSSDDRQNENEAEQEPPSHVDTTLIALAFIFEAQFSGLRDFARIALRQQRTFHCHR
jgi:hypothetical protein